jgi:hypothetical protein
MTFGNILCFQVTSCPKAVQNDDTRHAVVVSVGCFLLVRERPQPRPSCSFCWKIVASETIYRIAPMDLDGLFSRDFSYRISHRLSIRAPHGIAPRPVTLCTGTDELLYPSPQLVASPGSFHAVTSCLWGDRCVKAGVKHPSFRPNRSLGYDLPFAKHTKSYWTWSQK